MVTAKGKGSALSGQARFLILEIPKPIGRETRILGCAVPMTGVYDPYRHYRPWLKDPNLSHDDLDKLESLSALLWAEEPRGTVVLRDNAIERSSLKESDAQAQLTDLFRASVSRFKGHDVQITAGEAKMYQMDMVAGVVNSHLATSSPWMAQLNILYNEIGRPHQNPCLCLVTGVYTCKGLEVSWKRDAEGASGFEAKLPIGQVAVSDAINATKLNIGLKLSSEKSEGSTVFARCDDELVFALAYDELLLQLEDIPEQAKPGFYSVKNFFKARDTSKASECKIVNVILGKPIRGEGIQPFAGELDEDDGAEFGYSEPEFTLITRSEVERNAPPETDNGHA